MNPLLAFLLMGGIAAADQTRGEWFRSLMRPDLGTSCCDAADCKRTVADWRDGQWFATVEERMVPVPPGKVLRNPPSFDGEAYVCVHQGQILCFIKPSPGT